MQDWSISFKLSDLWTAYIAGAMSVKNHPEVSEKIIQRSADAYTKLIQENEVDKQVEIENKQKEMNDFKQLNIGDKIRFENLLGSSLLIREGIIETIIANFGYYTYDYYNVLCNDVIGKPCIVGLFREQIKEKFNSKTNQYEKV